MGGRGKHDNPECRSSETDRNSGHLEDRKEASIAPETEGGISSREPVLSNTTERKRTERRPLGELTYQY